MYPRLAVILVSMLLASAAQAESTVAACVLIEDAAVRLQCYDQASVPVEPAGAKPAVSIWDEHIVKDAERETFTLSTRKPNYFMYTYQRSPNQLPYEFSGQSDRLDNSEIKFQLSLQSKLADDLFGRHGDLWFEYTQVAYWQLFNSDVSAPFRETNYAPEVYLSFLTDYSLLGLTGRVVNVGIVHQSNGRSEPLSRSWNRVFAEFQFVRGDFALSIKPWARFNEAAEDDNNPDIVDYLGHYELNAYYNWNGHILKMMLRNVTDNDQRYNSELQWSFPIARHLRGMVQWYNGYGENLIDYNHDSHRIGIGLLLTDWL